MEDVIRTFKECTVIDFDTEFSPTTSLLRLITMCARIDDGYVAVLIDWLKFEGGDKEVAKGLIRESIFFHDDHIMPHRQINTFDFRHDQKVLTQAGILLSSMDTPSTECDLKFSLFDVFPEVYTSWSKDLGHFTTL